MFPMLIFGLSVLALVLIVAAHGTRYAVQIDQDAYEDACREAQDRRRATERRVGDHRAA